MGLTMDESNIYSLHVPSGPTSFATERPNYNDLTLQQLITRKDNLEEELKALGSVLDRHKVTMQSSLTTFDGFPRADIDVAQVRVTRARIIHLRNDWKELMDRIEKALHEHHANTQEENAKNPQPDPSSVRESTISPPAAPETPFARVNSVEPGSPANEAGLMTGDLIRRFGDAIWSNHERLRKVGEVVQQNTGRPILVRISRKGEGETQEMDLRLTPRQGWGGRGSLGCHIVLLT
jgi:26S proteasome non-ATPase regulatory subunit 9